MEAHMHLYSVRKDRTLDLKSLSKVTCRLVNVVIVLNICYTLNTVKMTNNEKMS